MRPESHLAAVRFVDAGRIPASGLNWYLDPNTRFMLNYIQANLEDVGDTKIVQSRFQLNF